MASILFVDDELPARENYRTILEHYGHEVVLSSNVAEALESLKGQPGFDLVITDMRMGAKSGLDLLRESRTIAPETEVIVLTGHAELENAVEAMKLGASDYLTKDTDYKEIMLVVEKALEKQALKQEIERLRRRVGNEFSFRKIVGETGAIEQLRETLRRVAPTDSRVLITGESGTGKELVAETLHTNSLRKDAPFIAINCGAIPHDLQESELFGYVRGAFTGAVRDKIGLLESADRGTVFLDEIGEMTPESQVKLLRFLEKGEIAPVGSVKTKTINVRVVAATNRDLETAVKEHAFREDLYYRLKVVSVHVPPLRERKSDIPLLTEALLSELVQKVGSKANRFSSEAMQALIEYNWPGNVRELKNVIERALIFTDGAQIDIENLPEEIFSKSVSAPTNSDVVPLDQIEKNYILELLERNGGNKLLTAKQLNIASTTLYRKLRQYGIE